MHGGSDIATGGPGSVDGMERVKRVRSGSRLEEGIVEERKLQIWSSRGAGCHPCWGHERRKLRGIQWPTDFNLLA